MFAKERKEIILNLLEKNKRITIKELVKELNVSGTTIRTYLSELEEQKKLVRTHGGAILIEDLMMAEDTIVSRQDKSMNEKKEIAQIASKLINEGDTILLDSGTTCLELAKAIKEYNRLTVITNDLQIALEIQKGTNINAIFLGGTIRNNYECTIGSTVIKALKNYSVDKAFIAANALSILKGATTPYLENSLVKEAMIQCGQQKILLCDSSKIGKRTLCTFAEIKEFDILVTDNNITETDRKQIEEHGLKVIN